MQMYSYASSNKLSTTYKTLYLQTQWITVQLTDILSAQSLVNVSDKFQGYHEYPYRFQYFSSIIFMINSVCSGDHHNALTWTGNVAFGLVEDHLNI